MATFSALLALCEGNSPVPGEFPKHRPETRSFDTFFDLHLNKYLSKQSRHRWFETPTCSLRRYCNGVNTFRKAIAEIKGNVNFFHVREHRDFRWLITIWRLSNSGQVLQWRHNEHDGVSNHQPHGCLLNRLYKCRSKKTSKLRVTGLCAGNSSGQHAG